MAENTDYTATWKRYRIADSVQSDLDLCQQKKPERAKASKYLTNVTYLFTA